MVVFLWIARKHVIANPEEDYGGKSTEVDKACHLFKSLTDEKAKKKDKFARFVETFYEECMKYSPYHPPRGDVWKRWFTYRYNKIVTTHAKEVLKQEETPLQQRTARHDDTPHPNHGLLARENLQPMCLDGKFADDQGQTELRQAVKACLQTNCETKKTLTEQNNVVGEHFLQVLSGIEENWPPDHGY